jgi:NAD(P)H dehydrogenase (quinone)
LLRAATNVAIAARDEGVEAVVNMSQISAREEAKSPLSHTHWLTEQVFDWTNIGASHIHPGFFAEDLYLFTAGSIPREGKIYLPFVVGKHAPVSANDIARVVVGILIDPQSHVGKHYIVTGPLNMTLDEMANVFSKELGKPVEYVNIPVDAWKNALIEQAEMPEYLATHLAAVAVDHQNGIFSAETKVVETIGGRPAETLEEFIRRHIDIFGGQPELAESTV